MHVSVCFPDVNLKVATFKVGFRNVRFSFWHPSSDPKTATLGIQGSSHVTSSSFFNESLLAVKQFQ